MGTEPRTISKADALAEAYKRGLLSPEKKAAYEEAQRRGLIGGAAPAQKRPVTPLGTTGEWDLSKFEELQPAASAGRDLEAERQALIADKEAYRTGRESMVVGQALDQAAQRDPMLHMVKPEARLRTALQQPQIAQPARPAPAMSPAEQGELDDAYPFGETPADPEASKRRLGYMIEGTDPAMRRGTFGYGTARNPTEYAERRMMEDAIRDDVGKGVKTAPLDIWNAGVGATEAVGNIIPDAADWVGSFSRNEDGSPAFAPSPRFDLEKARMEVSPEDQSVTGGLVESLAQFIAGRKAVGSIAPGGGTAAQLGKDIATVGAAFGGDTPHIIDTIDINAIPAGPLRDYAAWLRLQPEDSAAVGRFKNILKEATIASAGYGAPLLAVRGVQASRNAMRGPAVTTNAGGAVTPEPIPEPPVAAAPRTAPNFDEGAYRNLLAEVEAAKASGDAGRLARAKQAVSDEWNRLGAAPTDPTAVHDWDQASQGFVRRPSAPQPTPQPSVTPVAPPTVAPALGPAEQAFNALPMKARESMLRAFQSAGIDANRAKSMIGELNTLPEGQRTMYALELMRRNGLSDPDIDSVLIAMGREWATEAPRPAGRMFNREPDSARRVMNDQVRTQINSEGQAITDVAERNFGPGVVPAGEALERELDHLSNAYENILSTRRSPTGRLRSPTKKDAVYKARESLTNSLLSPEVMQTIPPDVKLQIMMQASDDMRRLKFSPDDLQTILKDDGAVLAPLFEGYGALQWSPELWQHLARQYPTQAAHSLQSALRKASDEAFRNGNATWGRYYQRLRGESGEGGILDMLERAVPGYKQTRVQFGDAKSAQEALEILERFKAAAASEGDVAAIIKDLKNLPQRHREMAEQQITSIVRQELARKVESPRLAELGQEVAQTPNLTSLSRQDFLKALEDVFGERGKELADAIRTSRARTDTLTSISPKYNSRTEVNRQDVANALGLYEAPGSLEGGVVDQGVKRLGAMAGGASLFPGGQGAAVALGATAGIQAALNAARRGKRLSNSERNALVDFMFRSRTGGDAPPAQGPRGPSAGNYAAAVGRDAVIGAGIGAVADGDPLNNDPAALALGALGGAGAGVARTRMRNARSLIQPPRTGNALTRGPAGRTPPGTPRRPPNQAGFGGPRNLPMDEASRMERAEADGFDTSRVLYHGSPERNIDQMRRGTGYLGDGVYLTTDRKAAAGYKRQSGNERGVSTLKMASRAFTGKVYETFVRGKGVSAEEYQQLVNKLNLEAARGNIFAADPSQTRAKMLAQAQLAEQGITHVIDGDLVMVFSPANIRSVNAAFDPSQEGSSKLLAGIGNSAAPEAGVGAGSAYIASQRDPDTDGDGVVSEQEAFEHRGSIGGSFLLGAMGTGLARNALARGPKGSRKGPPDINSMGFGGGRAPRPLMAPRVTERLKKRGPTISEESRNALARNAMRPPAMRQNAYEATGRDPALIELAAPFMTGANVGGARKAYSVLKQKLPKLDEYIAAVRADAARASETPAMETAAALRKKAEDMRRGAKSAASRWQNENFDFAREEAGKPQRKLPADKRSRLENATRIAEMADEALRLLNTTANDIEWLQREATRRLREIDEAIQRGMSDPAFMNAKPRTREEARDMARLIFEVENAAMLEDILSGAVQPRSRSEAHMALALGAGLPIAGFGASLAIADIMANVEERRKARDAEKAKGDYVPDQATMNPKDPRFQWEPENIKKNRRAAQAVQIHLNALPANKDGGRFNLSIDAWGPKTEEAFRFWQKTNGFAPNGLITRDQWDLLEQQALQARRATR